MTQPRVKDGAMCDKSITRAELEGNVGPLHRSGSGTETAEARAVTRRASVFATETEMVFGT